jgi:hypothetical protein
MFVAVIFSSHQCGCYIEAIEMDEAVDLQAIYENIHNPCLAVVLEQTDAEWII